MSERNRALAEIKRCLQEAEDSILLIIRKGNDHLPAKAVEIDSLNKTIKKAIIDGAEGILIGDHRLDVHYVTDAAFTWLALAQEWRQYVDKLDGN